MGFNPKTDYAAIMAANPVGSMEYRTAQAARNEKIAAMNTAGTNTAGYTQTLNGLSMVNNPSVNQVIGSGMQAASAALGLPQNTPPVAVAPKNTTPSAYANVIGQVNPSQTQSITNLTGVNPLTSLQNNTPANQNTGANNPVLYQSPEAIPTPKPMGNTIPQQQVQQLPPPTPIQAPPAYNNPMTQQMLDVLKALSDKINNPTPFNPETSAGLKIGQQNAMNVVGREAARRNMYQDSNTPYQMQLAAQQLIPQYEQAYNQQQQQGIGNQLAMLGAMGTMDESQYNKYLNDIKNQQYVDTTNYNRTTNANETSYNRNQDVINRNDKQLEALGKVINPLTGKVDVTSNQSQIDAANKLAAETKTKNDYADNISIFKDNFQAEIDKVRNDGDPSNDWQVGILNKARDAEIAEKVNEEIRTIGQYENNYQAEIDKRAKSNDEVAKKLIPYLMMARIEKLKTQDASKAKAAQQEFENYIKLENLNLDKLTTEYNLRKPYYKPSSGSDGGISNQGYNKSDYYDSIDKQVASYIDSLRTVKDDFGGTVQRVYNNRPLVEQVTVPYSFENKTVLDMINGSNMTDAEKISMMKRYGIKPN